jgi:hypothetical protein
MTHTEIENMFDRMRLPYKKTSHQHRSGYKIGGYWTIPGENYEFRIVAILPRNNWGIEITRSMGAESNPVYLLSGEDGITFIQQLICDKFDINVDRLFGKNWQHHQERLGKYMHKRIEYLSLHQLKRA